MTLASAPDAFVATPIGRHVVGRTFVIGCPAADLAGAILWGAPDERDVRAMIAVVDFIQHPGLASRGCIFFDCSAVERVDAEALVQFVERTRAALPAWSARIARQATIIPNGVPGLLIAGVAPALALTHAFRFVSDLPAALAFLDHGGAAAAHADLAAAAAHARASSTALAQVRAALARDLVGATLEACAAALRVSTRSLQRELAEQATSFSTELRRARVAAAESLLRLGDLKIETIALRVGFGTASRMTAALRRELGVSASELRRRR